MTTIKKWGCLIFLCSGTILLHAQQEQAKPPKPDFSFGASLILSDPISDFASIDVFNPDAGFAEFGAGVGVFARFEYKSGLFIEINAEHIRRKSRVWSESIDEITNILDEQNDTEQLVFIAEENPKYRHTSLLVGPGFNFKLENFQIYIRSEFGLAHTRMTESKIRDNNEREYRFADSGDVIAAFGLGVGTIISDVLRIDFSFTNLGNPDFELATINSFGFDETISEFNLPVQVFEVGLGIMIVK